MAINYTLAARTWFNRVISPTRVVERDAPRWPRQRPTSGRSASAAAVTTPGV
jgi:hypothetical protein